MKNINYKQYLQSYDWRCKKINKLEQVNYKCEQCGYDGVVIPLDVHHKTYERLGNERLSDLIVLCRTCHKAQHGH